MVMDCAVVREIQVPFGKRLARTRAADFRFEIVKLVLIPKVELVNKN
jgi:hypothetical protein